MGFEPNLPPRHAFWWVYSLYPLFAFIWGTYLLIVNGVSGNFPAISWLSIGLDALGLFCLYCFLRQKPSFTRGFWILFATFYIIKLALALALLASIAVHTTWDGSNSSHVVLMDFFVIILGMPFLIAIILYAFGSKQIWAISRDETTNA